MSRRSAFPSAIRSGAAMVGLFQKFPHYQVTELLAQSGVDFVVLDAEHAPFSPDQLDSCILAGRACDLPVLVRVARTDDILAALDMGADGVFVPHCDGASAAKAMVDAARYRTGSRGFSPSTRAGGYGTRGLDPYMDAADLETVVVAQIEDAHALDRLDEIMAVPGIDAFFVGRGDLAASMRLEWNAPELDAAAESIASAARNAGVICGAYSNDPDMARRMRDMGISFLLSGADQTCLRSGAAALGKSMGMS